MSDMPPPPPPAEEHVQMYNITVLSDGPIRETFSNVFLGWAIGPEGAVMLTITDSDGRGTTWLNKDKVIKLRLDPIDVPGD